MNIKKILVIQDEHHADKVYLVTNLIEGTWPWSEPLTLKFEVTADEGPQYVKDNFPDVLEVETFVVPSTKRTPFSDRNKT